MARRNNRNRRTTRQAFGSGFEQLEARDVPAGGLSASVVNGNLVRLATGGGPIDLQADTAAGTPALVGFFTAADGTAAPATFTGSLTTAGQTVRGTFGLKEFSPTGGVAVTAANATVVVGGGGIGVELSDADGAFALLSTGLAGVVEAEDVSDGVGLAVIGVTGLNLDTTTTGVDYRVNTTGAAVDRTVATPIGDVRIQYTTTARVTEVAGPADIAVRGPDGVVVRAGATFTFTPAATGAAVAGSPVAVDLYAGTTRAVTLGSKTAGFTLSADGLGLAANSFTAGEFALPPGGTPVAAGQGSYPATAAGISASFGPVSPTEVRPELRGLSFGPAGLAVDVGVRAIRAAVTLTKGGEAESEDPIGAVADDLAGGPDWPGRSIRAPAG